MVVRTQTVSIQLQDSLRCPLLEGEFSQENGLLYVNQLGSVMYKTDLKLQLHFFNSQVGLSNSSTSFLYLHAVLSHVLILFSHYTNKYDLLLYNVNNITSTCIVCRMGLVV